MTKAQRLLLAAVLAGVAGLGPVTARAFWGSGPFGMFPGGWDGPGWGDWGSPWYGGYPYGGYPYGGYGYPYGGYTYPYGAYGSAFGYPYGAGVPYVWGAPAYGYPVIAAPAASAANTKTTN